MNFKQLNATHLTTLHEAQHILGETLRHPLRVDSGGGHTFKPWMSLLLFIPYVAGSLTLIVISGFAILLSHCIKVLQYATEGVLLIANMIPVLVMFVLLLPFTNRNGITKLGRKVSNEE